MHNNPNKTKLYLILAALLTGGLLIGVVSLMLDDPGTTEETAERTGDDFWEANADPTARDFGARVDKELLIRDYSEWAKYPPNSRPLRASHKDVLNYRKIPVAMQKMPVKRDDKIEMSPYSCLLQPEKHTVTEGETMRVMLSCHETGQRERRPLRIENFRLQARAGERKFTPPPPTVNDAGENGDRAAGDAIYTFEFRPRTGDWADMQLTVNFIVAGDPLSVKHSLRTHFFSSPVAPARFTGQFREEFRDGSLFIAAEVEVTKPGNYTIEANLMSNDDEPVAFARKDARLASGKHFVELKYYGKVLRDRDREAPFRLVGLRGTLNTDVIQPEVLARSPEEVAKFLRNIRDDRPKRMVIPYFPGHFQTQKYDLSVFTDEEYTSPAKERRLAELRALP